jgi:hypothetical protein
MLYDEGVKLHGREALVIQGPVIEIIGNHLSQTFVPKSPRVVTELLPTKLLTPHTYTKPLLVVCSPDTAPLSLTAFHRDFKHR